jgi:transmembrane sensor
VSQDFEDLKREASAWLVRITSGNATTDDADALKRWRSISPSHNQAFDETVLLWRNMGRATIPDRRHRLSRRSVILSGSVAASAAVVGVGLSNLGYLPSLTALTSDYATAVGQQRAFDLPDGSRATLDGDTALSLAYSAAERRLELASGAAVFEVAEDAVRPFVVTAAAGETMTFGRSFSIQHGSDDVVLECLDGLLDVRCRGTVALRTGETVAYSAAGLGERSILDLETASSWRKGLLIFHNRSLENVVADVNRHRRGKVIIASQRLRSRRVSGVFHLSRPEEILRHLEVTLNVQSYGLAGGIVVLR